MLIVNMRDIGNCLLTVRKKRDLRKQMLRKWPAFQTEHMPILNVGPLI